MTIENGDGQKLGRVSNLAVDVESGRLKYVIVASGGFVGLRTRFRAVPPGLLSAATAKRDVLAISLTKERWKQAPTFKLSEVDSLDDPNRERQTERFYRIANSKLPPTHHLAPTGKPSPKAQLKFVTDLFGQTVFNSEGEKLGEIRDVLVSLNPNGSALIVFSTGKLFKNREHAFAVPLRDTMMSRKSKLVLAAKRHQLDQADPFTQRVWETIGEKRASPRIFSYAISD